MPGRLERAGKIFENAWPVRLLLGAYYRHQFPKWAGTFSGVYQSFAEATEAAPPNSKLGYDHSELADLYADRHVKVQPSDYPMIFWLGRILRSATSVFDFGGHVGLQYYGYQKYLSYPSGLRWTVLDVPAIVERGRALATERGETRLAFTTDLADAANHEVFFASGSLQYTETSLAEQLRVLQVLPRHLLINKTPLYDGEDFVTLQNVIHAICPYRIFNRRAFLDPVLALGYELVDSWQTPDVFCRIPLDPERSLEAYTGLYLRLSESRT